MKLYLIDALGPFVDEKNPPHNWSTTPLYDEEGIIHHHERIIARFERFIERISALGYNAISIDDLPHLVTLDIYPEALQEKLCEYKKLYTELFALATRHNIKVFVNFDVMYFNQEIERYTKGSHKKIIHIIERSLTHLFEEYAVAGIITRVGECDGIDREGPFKSRLTIKNAKQARMYLKKLLPLFEKHDKTWIFRTWSVGAYRIGDMIWNRKTFTEVFKGIKSNSLVISIKYGETDFFRNLELNPLFETHGYHLIIELQTRREYDGFGELPFYTGWDYEKYYQALKNNPHLVGIFVWCMTGGWRKSNRVTFLENSSPWVELNTISTLEIFKGRKTAEQCIVDFFGSEKMIEYLKQYNALSKEIMYQDNEPVLYFRKLRVPPLLWIFWDNITINSFIKSYFSVIINDTVDLSEQDIRELHLLGQSCDVPRNTFITDTLFILYFCRKALESKITLEELHKKVAEYDKKYPGFFKFSISKTLDTKRAALMLRTLIRRDKKYRFIDSALLNRFYLFPIVRLLLAINKKYLPGFVGTQAMPFKTLLK